MPQLSAWRLRRNARRKERERLEAIEFHKLRKTAKRCCRNCLTPYRDQSPAGGRFMCSYCGHISKRPVLDLPVPPGMHISSPGIAKDLLAKNGKISSRKACSENSWMCGQNWLEDRNWINGPFMDNSTHWRKNPGVFFTGDDYCFTNKSYSIVFLSCKLLSFFFLSMRWLWRKMFRVSASGDDASPNAEQNTAQNGDNYHESRGEKARRKAEEKRQARLERELLEEEDRKQREEVARLVEERRRLRDESLGASRDRDKGTAPEKERENKKDVEKKRQERRKEKDKGSSKSNSDVEELEKRACKENEKKHEVDRKSEADRREHQKTGKDNVKVHSMEMGRGLQGNTANNLNRGYTGTRYLDRTEGTSLTSSASSKGSLFGKGSSTVAAAVMGVSKENKSNGFEDHTQSSASRRVSSPPEHFSEKLNVDVKDPSINHPVLPEPHPMTAPKMSWQQLFTPPSTVTPSSNANVISRPNVKPQADGQCSPLAVQSSLTQSFDNPIDFGLPTPIVLPAFPNVTASSAGFPYAAHSIFPHLGEAPCNVLPEDPEIFEDPCYNPDPVSLLGPVSESLDNFQLDLGTGFVTDVGIQRLHGLNNLSASSEVNKPSPIESPMSKFRFSDQRHDTSRAQDVHTHSTDDSSAANDVGTWQMWNSSPLGQDGLGLVGGTANWNFPLELNRLNKEDIGHSSSQRTMGSLFTQGDQVPPCVHSPQKAFTGNGQNIETFQHLSGSDTQFYLKRQEETAHDNMIYRSPRATVANHPFEPAPATSWAKTEWGAQGSEAGAGSTSVTRSPVGGGLFTTSDVKSVWSYE